MRSRILTVNGGSSTIKFAAFLSNGTPERILSGQVDGIGEPSGELIAKDQAGSRTHRISMRTSSHRDAAYRLIDWIAGWAGPERFHAIGHRVVHGGVRV